MKSQVLITLVTGLGVVTGGLCSGTSQTIAEDGRGVSAADDQQDIQGTWWGIESWFNGNDLDKGVPGRLEPGQVKNMKAIFDRDKVTFVWPGENKELPAPYTLNQGTDRRQIDISYTDREGKLHKLMGIYRIQNDELQVCLRELKRPDEFLSKSGEFCWYSHVRRQ